VPRTMFDNARSAIPSRHCWLCCAALMGYLRTCHLKHVMAGVVWPTGQQTALVLVAAVCCRRSCMWWEAVQSLSVRSDSSETWQQGGPFESRDEPIESRDAQIGWQDEQASSRQRVPPTM